MYSVIKPVMEYWQKKHPKTIHIFKLTFWAENANKGLQQKQIYVVKTC